MGYKKQFEGRKLRKISSKWQLQVLFTIMWKNGLKITKSTFCPLYAIR